MVRKIVVMLFSLLIMPFNGYSSLPEIDTWKKSGRFTSEGFLKKPNRISPFCSNPQNSIIEESEEDEAFEQEALKENSMPTFIPSSFLIPGFSEAPEQKKNFKEQLARVAKSLLPEIPEQRFYFSVLESDSETDSEKEPSKSENASSFFELAKKTQSRFFQSCSDSSDSECSENDFEPAPENNSFQQIITDDELAAGKFDTCFTKEQLEVLRAVAAINEGIVSIKINTNDFETRKKINQAILIWQPPVQEKDSEERVRSNSF